jgi:hypothetical protein
MRITHAVLATASFASMAWGLSACTVITLGMWSGYTDGSDGGSITNPQAQTACNTTYLSSLSACGTCISTNCAPGLAAVCKLDAGHTTPWPDTDLLTCAKNPTVGSFDCNQFLKAPDAAPSQGTDPGALESNVTQCVKNSCHDACRRCVITYPGCSNSTAITLGEEKSRGCGKCIVNNCPVELANACGANLDQAPIIACAQNPTDNCQATDCSGLHKPDAGSSQAAYSCILNSCANECQ